MEKPEPKVTNCLVKRRPGDSCLFYQADSQIIPNLDGYAVIPLEEYEALLAKSG